MFYFGSSAIICLPAASGHLFTNCSLLPTAHKGGVFKASRRPLGQISTMAQPQPPVSACASSPLQPLSCVPASLVGHFSEHLWKAWNEKETVGHIPAASTQHAWAFAIPARLLAKPWCLPPSLLSLSRVSQNVLPPPGPIPDQLPQTLRGPCLDASKADE